MFCYLFVVIPARALVFVGVVCCCCSSSIAGVALVSEVLAFVIVVVFIRAEGLSSIVVVTGSKVTYFPTPIIL